MSDFILYYDMLEAVANHSKSLGKRAAEYADDLESKIIRGIGTVTGPSSGYLLSASDSVRDKITALKQKSEAFYQFAEQIIKLLEVAKQMDQEVADAITAQRGELEHNKAMGLEDWKAKLIDLLVDIKNGSSLLSTIADILGGMAAIHESLEASIKHWYEVEGGKRKVKGALGKLETHSNIAGVAATGIGVTSLFNGKEIDLLKNGPLSCSNLNNWKGNGKVELKNNIKNGYSNGSEIKRVEDNSQVAYTQLNINNIRPAVLDKINRYIDKIKTMNDTETCWEPLYKCNVKWTRADYENALDKLLADLTCPTGAAIENVLSRTSNVITGSMQFIGGITEAGTGASITAGTSWTGVGIPIGIAGGYITIDGASNVSGGASKVASALFGSNQGDTKNFMKNAYISISPEYGENIYNATQIGIGLFTIGKGLTELPADAVSVYARPKNISRANVEGLSTKTIAIDAGKQIVLTTKTDSGMILQKTIIDKSKLANGTLLIGVDTINASGSASSIKQK